MVLAVLAGGVTAWRVDAARAAAAQDHTRAPSPPRAGGSPAKVRAGTAYREYWHFEQP